MAPRDVGASRSSQCDWRDLRSPPSPFARIAIPSTLSLSPPGTLSLASLGHPLLPTPLHVRVRLFLSFVPSVTPPASISRLFFLVVLLVSIYLTPCVMYILAPPSSLEISPRLSLSLPFFLILPSYLVALSTLISFSPSHPRFSLLALSRASPSVPRQPSRHRPSWSRERQLGQSCAG